jgi:two-component system, LytTR family, response regulator
MKPLPIEESLLLLPTNKGTAIIHCRSIIRIEAISNYSRLYFADGKTLVVAKVLRWFEAQLPPRQFIRTHRAHFINRDFISLYINGASGKVQLVNGEWIEVARRKKTHFLKCLNGSVVPNYL